MNTTTIVILSIVAYLILAIAWTITAHGEPDAASVYGPGTDHMGWEDAISVGFIMPVLILPNIATPVVLYVAIRKIVKGIKG